MGIWALVVLYRADVQKAFASNARKHHGTRPAHHSQPVGPATPVSRARRVGQLSLIAAILGCVVPIILGILFWILEDKFNMNPPYSLCLFSFLGLELIALGTGIEGWRSPCGKAGIGISLLLLLVTRLLLVSTFGPITHEEVYKKSPAPVESIRKVQP